MEREHTVVIATGGNALIVDEEHKAIPDQYKAAATTCHHIADMIDLGWNIVVTHGKGPQVGYILRRSEIALEEVSPVPMDYAGADTQGAIGYMFQRALRNEMHKRNMKRSPVTVVTQIMVDASDPELSNPSKPIGSHMTEEFAKKHAKIQGWTICEEGKGKWRRLVPSPRPVSTVEIDSIKALVDKNFLVIACGGGGIPVSSDETGELRGVEAVIDKDYVSGLLASNLAAELLVIATAVEKVSLGFGTTQQTWVDKMLVSEARQYLGAGEFPSGSMGPKIEAILEFLGAGGRAGLITNPPNLGRAVAGHTGTWIYPD